MTTSTSNTAVQASTQAAPNQPLPAGLNAYMPTENAIIEPTTGYLRILSHHQYHTAEHLTPTSVLPSPLDQFECWFAEAERARLHEPGTMALSTASAAGAPSSRFVLLKLVDRSGFVFFTNYASRKSKELEANPQAALAFYWPEMHRQVRVVGCAEKVSRKESEDYFRTRPLGSRLGAWASHQSCVVGEDEVAERMKQTKERFGVKDEQTDADIPLPELWGGWRIVPREVEFWSGKPSRLHDRIQYTRIQGLDNEWKIERLAP